MHASIQQTLSHGTLMPDVFDAGDTKTTGTRLALEYWQPPMGGQCAGMRVWSVRSANVS